MNVGTIGSGIVVDRMIEAMSLTEGLNLYCVYSRTKERAMAFAEKHNVNCYYTDLDKMLLDDNIDIVYIASPNSLHYVQAKKALLARKHVICEKSFTPTLKECIELFELAKENNVFIFEAITTIHLPNYALVKEHLKDCGDLKFVQCNFSQYSSRYEKYKNHEYTNIFDPAFNGGALMDINVYCIHFVTGIFGKPNSVSYIANRGYNGIDTSGILIMRYPGFIATCVGAKDSSSENHVYIQGDQGTIRVFGSSCGVCSDVEFIPPKKDMIGKKDVSQALDIGVDQIMHMTYECAEFERIIRLQDMKAYEKLCDQTKLVVSILEECSK